MDLTLFFFFGIPILLCVSAIDFWDFVKSIYWTKPSLKNENMNNEFDRHELTEKSLKIVKETLFKLVEETGS